MKKQLPKIVRIFLIGIGLISLVLGTVGIFLPVLPTTPFLLLSAASFAHGSQRFYDWLMNNRWFGAYIRNYQEGKGIARHHKIIAISTLWVTIGTSAIFLISAWWVRGVLLLIAIGVTFHLISFPTLDQKHEVFNRRENDRNKLP